MHVTDSETDMLINHFAKVILAFSEAVQLKHDNKMTILRDLKLQQQNEAIKGQPNDLFLWNCWRNKA